VAATIFLLTTPLPQPYSASITEKGGGPVEMINGCNSDETKREVIDCWSSLDHLKAPTVPGAAMTVDRLPHA